MTKIYPEVVNYFSCHSGFKSYLLSLIILLLYSHRGYKIHLIDYFYLIN